jgi:hypothetical protein
MLRAFLLLVPCIASASVISLSGTGYYDRDVDGGAWSLFLSGEGVSLTSYGVSTQSQCFFNGGLCRPETSGGLASIGGVSSRYYGYSLVGPEGGLWTGSLTLYATPVPLFSYGFSTVLATADIQTYESSHFQSRYSGSSLGITTYTFSATPEPSTIWLALVGAASLAGLRLRCRTASRRRPGGRTRS